MDKYERESKDKGRESWKFAWAMDITEQERAKGKTEECARAFFKTAHKRFCLLDAPVCGEFVQISVLPSFPSIYSSIYDYLICNILSWLTL